MTGRVMQPRGNYDPTMVLRQLPLRKGRTGWVSIAIATDRGVARAEGGVGQPGVDVRPQIRQPIWAAQAPPELDQNLAQWTAGRSAETVTNCAAHGVAAVPVMGAEERRFNSHFRERGLYADIDHPRWGGAHL